jgi:hypothetical protein
MNIFTHNPWGEYGHEDHVQVYRIVESLRRELGFKLRVSSYISSRSEPLARQYAETDSVQPLWCPIDPSVAADVADTYKRHGCWTWTDDWTWGKDECFLGSPVQRSPESCLSSLVTSKPLRRIPFSVH